MKIRAIFFLVTLLASVHVGAQGNISISVLLGKNQTESKKDCTDCAGTILTWEAKPSTNPIEYSSSPANTAPDQFKALLNTSSLAGVMLLEGTQIVHEKYHPGVTRDTTVLSMSRAKSVISMALGKALCSGKISSLNDRAQKYLPELENTIYGKSKIVSLLEMSSGASTGLPHGDVVSGEAVRWLQGVKSQVETLGQYKAEFFSGEGTFKYKNQDPSVITQIIHRVYDGDINAYFQKNIWDAVGAKSGATWALDKKSVPIGSSFLMATTGDWGRLGIYISSVLTKKIDDDCMFNYLKAATQTRKKSDNKFFNGYGYFFWTHHWLDTRNEIIWMLGVAGQLVAIHPPTDKVMVYNSLSDHQVDAVATAFVRWVYQK